MSDETAKRAAAEAAVALVRNWMILGLGTGSTMRYALDALGRRVLEEGLVVRGVATSLQTEREARRLGIPLTDLGRDPQLDIAIDGCDEIERGSLRLIKGLGGALLREKIVAQCSTQFIVIADESKVVSRLGERSPLPVEVIPFGHEASARRLAAIGLRPVLRMEADAPFVTDNANYIYDCHDLLDAVGLEPEIHAIAGVMGSGLFMGGVAQAFVGREDGTVETLLPG